jgi:polysaccharide export outer membrane protein
MKKRTLLLLVLIMVPPIIRAQEASYSIGASDLLEISVWGEQNLTRQVTVRNDGFISLPLAGDILAAGKTPPQLKKDIETILTKYIKDPRCAVIVIEPRSKRFYIQGQVTRPGQYTLDQDLYLTQVIPLAGGFTEWADQGDIVILRIEGDKKTRLYVDYKKILKGKVEDILIKPGDTIIVP